MMNALDLAILFHDTYERLAPDFGYEARTDTRQFDPTIPNGQLMVAVCGEILENVFVAIPEDLSMVEFMNALPPRVIEFYGEKIAII